MSALCYGAQPNRRHRNVALGVGLAGLGHGLHVAEADGGEEELGDLERVEVGPAPGLHVGGREEVVPGQHAQHQGEPAALEEVVLEVAGVFAQCGTGWHQQGINNLEGRRQTETERENRVCYKLGGKKF